MSGDSYPIEMLLLYRGRLDGLEVDTQLDKDGQNRKAASEFASSLWKSVLGLRGIDPSSSSVDIAREVAMSTAPMTPRSTWEKLDLTIKAAATVVSAISLIAAVIGGMARMLRGQERLDLVSVIPGVGAGLLFFSSLTLLVVALRRRNVVFLPDRTDLVEDSKLGIVPTLRDLASQRGELIVMGRTCHQWFSQSETARVSSQTALGLLETAAERGAVLSFYVMSPSKVPELEGFAKASDKRAQLRKELKEVETMFRQAKERLSKSSSDAAKRFKLLFTNRPVPNSKSLLKSERGKLLRFVCELGTDFEVKPAIAFLGEASSKKDAKFLRALRRDIEEVEGFLDAEGKDGVFEKRTKGRTDIEKLINKYHFAPNLRRNSAASLARTYLAHYRHLQYPDTFDRSPPVTIQLQVTHHCTTQCKMCRHYRIGEVPGRKNGPREPELTVAELRLVVEAIAKLGVRTLIVSGGEPLYRKEELFDVLQTSKNHKLKTGLLTNGIKPGNLPLSLEDCHKLFSTCEWVQLSIDSFDAETYAHIRSAGELNTVLESLANLRKALMERGEELREHLEICYTIQKDNIAEVPHTKDQLHSCGLDWCWDLLRFKYAHGPQPSCKADGKAMSKDDEFLCKAEEVAALMRDMSGDQHFAYLKSRFRAIDIASGTPTRDMRGGKCQALNLTCTIDAFGNVYPCCFLFDDNNDRSDFREKYRIGSLRPHQEAVDESCEELLRKAWQGDQLNELRNRDLMVDDRACCYCTRHMYNNEFLNELQGILQNCGQHFDLEALEEEILTATPGTGSYWV